MLAHEGQRSASVAAAEGTVTADMVAQFAYCPRRFHLAYVEGRWADNAETDDGRFTHRRVDAVDQPLPAPDQVTAENHTLRSVTLHDEARAISAKLDAVEVWRDEATGEAAAFPVETKSGAVPETAEGTWEPERVQLMMQGLVLRASGFATTAGAVYYAASSRRVEVALDEPLLARTLALVDAVREGLKGRDFPAPLEDSPKCPRCSLVGICLPDETRASTHEGSAPGGEAAPEVRRLFPARDDATPLYVQEQGAFVGKHGEVLTVTREGERLADARLKDVSQLVLCGSIGVSSAALHLLCESGKPIVHLTRGHWFCGITQGHGLRNGFDRAAQFRVAGEAERCLALAREFVKAKGTNQRTMLRRNAVPPQDQELSEIARLIGRVDEVTALDELLGIEGSIAARYFGRFGTMLRPKDQATEGGEGAWDFDFGCRNRRPPRVR